MVKKIYNLHGFMVSLEAFRKLETIANKMIPKTTPMEIFERFVNDSYEHFLVKPKIETISYEKIDRPDFVSNKFDFDKDKSRVDILEYNQKKMAKEILKLANMCHFFREKGEDMSGNDGRGSNLIKNSKKLAQDLNEQSKKLEKHGVKIEIIEKNLNILDAKLIEFRDIIANMNQWYKQFEIYSPMLEKVFGKEEEIEKKFKEIDENTEKMIRLRKIKDKEYRQYAVNKVNDGFVNVEDLFDKEEKKEANIEAEFEELMNGERKAMYEFDEVKEMNEVKHAKEMNEEKIGREY